MISAAVYGTRGFQDPDSSSASAASSPADRCCHGDTQMRDCGAAEWTRSAALLPFKVAVDVSSGSSSSHFASVSAVRARLRLRPVGQSSELVSTQTAGPWAGCTHPPAFSAGSVLSPGPRSCLPPDTSAAVRTEPVALARLQLREAAPLDQADKGLSPCLSC